MIDIHRKTHGFNFLEITWKFINTDVNLVERSIDASIVIFEKPRGNCSDEFVVRFA